MSRKYWDKKVNKIFVPYWITTMLWIVIFQRDISAVVVAKNLLFIDYARNIDGTMWYMSLLALFYVLAYVLFGLHVRDEIKILLFIVASFCIKELAAAQAFAECSWQFMNNYLSFTIGVMLGYLFTWAQKHNIKLENNYWKVCLFIICVIGYRYNLLIDRNNLQALGIVFSIGMILAISIITKLLEDRDIKLLRLIGENSYMLYLLEGKLLNLSTYYININSAIIKVIIYIFSLIFATFVCSKFIHCFEMKNEVCNN